jgi:uncharacterized protein YggE
MAILNNDKGGGFWPSWSENRLFALLLGILIVYLIVFFAFAIKNEAIQSNAIGKAPAERKTISFDGTGKVVGTPDIATADLGMTTQDKDVQTALKNNNQKINDLIAKLKQVGIPAADIQTSQFNVSPNYDYSNNRQTITGYTASQSVTVKVRNLDLVSSVLDTVGAVGANQVSGLNFTIDNPEQLQAQAREKAIADAVSKASVLETQLGIKLTRVVNFSESNGGVTPLPYYSMKDMAVGGAAPTSVAPSIQTGSQDIVSNVTLTFEIQ